MTKLSKEYQGKIGQILLLVVLLLVAVFSCWRLVTLQDAVTNLCNASGPEQPLIDCPLWADQLVNLVREIYAANRGILPFMVGAVILTIIAIVATSWLDMKLFAGCFGVILLLELIIFPVVMVLFTFMMGMMN